MTRKKKTSEKSITKKGSSNTPEGPRKNISSSKKRKKAYTVKGEYPKKNRVKRASATKKRKKAVSVLQQQSETEYTGFTKKTFPKRKVPKKQRPPLFTPFGNTLLIGFSAFLLLAFVFILSSDLRFSTNRHQTRQKATEEIPSPKEYTESDLSVKRKDKSVIEKKSTKVRPRKKTFPTAKTAPVVLHTKEKGPYLVFVLDDLGYTKKDHHILSDLGDNVTYAILPLLPYSTYFSTLSKITGAEVILHLPLESLNGPEKDPGKICPNMTREEVIDQLLKDLRTVPAATGINTHKGSLATADPRLMTIILERVKAEGMFFLDSYTTPRSVVGDICESLGMTRLRRDIFLDNINEPTAIKRQIEKMLVIAEKKGYAIAIGHYRPATLRIIKESIPAIKAKGFEIISLQRLTELKNNRTVP